MKKVTMTDAPIWYNSKGALAWADGYNAAVEKMATVQEDLYDKITETTTTVWEGRGKRNASKTGIKTNSKMTADKEDSDEMIRAKNIVQKAVISLEAIFEELSELEKSK